jgi:DNA-binding transcriptional LysR family regulator
MDRGAKGSDIIRHRPNVGVARTLAAGIGLGPPPEFFLGDPACKDVLVPVLPDFALESAMFYFLYVSRAHVPRKIRTFIE